MNLSLSTRQWVITGLVVITALIHLGLGGWSNPLFIANGIGYLVLILCLYFFPQLESQRSLIRYALIGYTAVTFILYFVFNWPDIFSPVGLLDKAVELVLIILLWLDRNDN
ncbi:MAG TPA: hypothetical protein PLD25_13595 [Chloroflexota bacterium]|nr:hypothetical protein [Chloroflexota bacterium]